LERIWGDALLLSEPGLDPAAEADEDVDRQADVQAIDLLFRVVKGIATVNVHDPQDLQALFLQTRDMGFGQFRHGRAIEALGVAILLVVFVVGSRRNYSVHGILLWSSGFLEIENFLEQFKNKTYYCNTV